MDAKKRSRWRDEDEDTELMEKKRQEKEKKKKLKQEKKAVAAAAIESKTGNKIATASQSPKISNDARPSDLRDSGLKISDEGILQFNAPLIKSCRSVENYERLNHIEEGTYGVVFKGRDLVTGEVYALKKLKADKNQQGFPITSLREIHTLQQITHPNVVGIKELVVGGSLDQ